jgi:TolB-like protein
VFVDAFDASPLITRAVIVLALVILPFAIWLAWTYDLKEQGVERTGGEAQPAQIALPWHRIAFPVTISVLMLTGSLAFFSLNSNAAALDSELVAVLPFRVNAGNDLEYLRNGMMEMLAARLNQSGGLHAADPATVLAAYARIAGGEQAVLPLSRAEQVAHEVGAGQLVTGSVVGTSAQLTVTATLVSLATGQSTSGSIQASASNLQRAASDLMTQLLETQKKTR